jgi:hypothetical protein
MMRQFVDHYGIAGDSRSLKPCTGADILSLRSFTMAGKVTEYLNVFYLFLFSK